MSDEDTITTVDPGRLVARKFGEYFLIEPLGEGGMGTVHLAVHAPASGVERPVALKRLRADLCGDEQFTQMFRDEVRLAARLNHPFVARLLQAGEHEGQLFYTMDLLLGVSLSSILKHLTATEDRELLEMWPSVAVRLISDACEGLHAAHELRGSDGAKLGVVHRDISPDNLFVGFDGAVRVIDFGIASARARLVRTNAGRVRGKVSYAAPERLATHPTIDRRADIWSLGVVAWESLAMRRLFKHSDTLSLIDAITSADVPPLLEVRPALGGEVAATFDEVIGRALRRDPETRFPTAREFGRALSAAARASSSSVDLPEVAEWMNQLLPEASARQERFAQLAATARRDAIDVRDDDSRPVVTRGEPRTTATTLVRSGPRGAAASEETSGDDPLSAEEETTDRRATDAAGRTSESPQPGPWLTSSVLAMTLALVVTVLVLGWFLR